MRIRSGPGVSLALVLGLLLALPAFPQSGGYGSIGPGKGEVIGGIAGGADVLGVVGYLIYHETHKPPTITGCLTSKADGLSLTNKKDQKVYTLNGNLAALEPGEKVATLPLVVRRSLWRALVIQEKGRVQRNRHGSKRDGRLQ